MGTRRYRASERISRIRFALPKDNEITEPESKFRKALSTMSDTTVKPIRPRTSSVPSLTEISSIEGDNESKIGPYLVGGMLGQGTQGTVCKALDTTTGKFVAIKEIKLRDGNRQALVAAISREIELLQNLDHPNIVKYITTLRRGEYIYIVFEFIENGSLYDILQNFGVFTEPLASLYVKQILQGLVCLHEKNIVHRDIKGANVLITKDGTCKLGDFGLAVTATRLSVNRMAVGTSYWMAPEFISGSVEEVTASSDIWSLGATVVELITGHPPLHEYTPMVAAYKLIEGNIVPIPKGISVELHSFLELCFTLDPEKRATAKQLLVHPWIVGARRKRITKNWDELTKELKSNRGHSTIARRRIIKPKRATSMAVSGTTFPPKRQLEKTLQSLPKTESELDELSVEDMKKHYLELLSQSTTLLEAANKIEKKLEKSTVTWHSSNSQLSLRQTNQHLREKIQLLEQNINISNHKRAEMIFGEITWGSFEPSARGVLKIAKKCGGKFRKRHVVLLDNFFFIFKVGAEDDDIPLDVIWLTEVTVNTNISDVYRYPTNTFEVKTRDRYVLLCAASAEIMEKWMKKIGFAKCWFDVEEYSRLCSPRPNFYEDSPKSIFSFVRKKVRHAL